MATVLLSGSLNPVEYLMDRRESAEVSGLLYIGFLADRLLLALDAHGPEAVASAEAGLVNDLVRFLTSVKELAEHPVTLLSGESAGFAFPPAQQVGLRLISSRVDSANLKYFAHLEGAAKSLGRGRVPSRAALERLRDFLEMIAEASLEQVDDWQVREEAGTGERRSPVEWQKTSTA